MSFGLKFECRENKLVVMCVDTCNIVSKCYNNHGGHRAPTNDTPGSSQLGDLLYAVFVHTGPVFNSGR